MLWIFLGLAVLIAASLVSLFQHRKRLDAAREAFFRERARQPFSPCPAEVGAPFHFSDHFRLQCYRGPLVASLPGAGA